MGPINNHIVSSYFMSGGEHCRTKLVLFFKFPQPWPSFTSALWTLCFLCLQMQEFGIILMMCWLDHSFTLPLIHYYGQMCTKYIITGPQRDGHEIWMSLSGFKMPWNRFKSVRYHFRTVSFKVVTSNILLAENSILYLYDYIAFQKD